MCSECIKCGIKESRKEIVLATGECLNCTVEKKENEFKEYMNKCNHEECEQRGKCEGCYEEYLEEKNNFDEDKYNLIVDSLNKQFNIK